MFGAISEGLFGSPSTNKEHANEKNAVYAGEPVGTPQELTLAVEFPSFPPIPYHVQVWPWETIAPSLARVTRNQKLAAGCHTVSRGRSSADGCGCSERRVWHGPQVLPPRPEGEVLDAVRFARQAKTSLHYKTR
jgi:hypothetical protein